MTENHQLCNKNKTLRLELLYRVSQKIWEFSDEYEIVFVINKYLPNFKSLNIIMSARVYFMKTVNGCKDVSIYVSTWWTVKTDKFTLFVYCNFLVLLSTPLCSQKINKQIVNIADENLLHLQNIYPPPRKNPYIRLWRETFLVFFLWLFST